MADPASAVARAYADTPLPDPGLGWREVTFSVVDLETTGLDPSRDEIISFASVTVAGGRVRLDNARYELIRPERMPEGDTIRIHGLREADLEEAPPLADVLDVLLEALTGAVLVAHVAAVERGFLGAALGARGLELRNTLVDTAALHAELRRLRREPPSVHEPIGLSDLAREMGLPVHRPHHAAGDALTTAQAFIALASHLEPLGAGNLGKFVHMSHPAQEKPASLGSLLGRFGLGRRNA
jgi:DNA polymerase III subunit epsilon